MTTSAVNLSSKMASETELYDTSETVEMRHGYYMMFSSMLFFQLLNYIVCKVGTPKSVREDPWRWRNLFISWIHAFFCGTWDILWYDLIICVNKCKFIMISITVSRLVWFCIRVLGEAMPLTSLKIWNDQIFPYLTFHNI